MSSAFKTIPTPVSIANGGTSATTAAAAFSALSPVTTTGDLIYSSSGTTNSRLAIGTEGKGLRSIGGVPAYAWQATTVAKSANYTITDTDGYTTVLVTTSSSTITVTMPAAANNTNREITVKKVDSGSGKVTIAMNGAETVDGVTTFDLGTGASNQYSYAKMVSDGTTWWTVAQNGDYIEAACSSDTSTSGANTYADVTGASITLSPGMYLVGASGAMDISQVSGNVAGNMAIRSGASTVITNLVRGSSSGASVSTHISAQTKVNITASTTYKLSIRVSGASNVATVTATNLSGGLTDPDTTTLIWARRL